LGVYLFQKFIQQNKSYYLYLSITAFGLTFYTYNTANIFVPLLVVGLIISNWKKFFSILSFKKIIISLGLTLLFIIPILTQIFSGQAANRFGLVNIFNDPKTINQIIDRRTSFSATSPKQERFFYNKATAWTTAFFQNYLEAISPLVLFNKGDTINIRHNIPGFGLLFLSFDMSDPFILEEMKVGDLIYCGYMQLVNLFFNLEKRYQESKKGIILIIDNVELNLHPLVLRELIKGKRLY
jgi:hypothetical protein